MNIPDFSFFLIYVNEIKSWKLRSIITYTQHWFRVRMFTKGMNENISYERTFLTALLKERVMKPICFDGVIDGHNIHMWKNEQSIVD